MDYLGRGLILIGIISITLGALLILLSKIPFGSIPGDIIIKRENFTLIVPIGTSLILSLLLSVFLSLILNLFLRGGGH